MQEEREITGNISEESREHCVQLFAELGKKIDRVAAYLRTQQRKASIAAEEAQRLPLSPSNMGAALLDSLI